MLNTALRPVNQMSVQPPRSQMRVGGHGIDHVPSGGSRRSGVQTHFGGAVGAGVVDSALRITSRNSLPSLRK